MSGSRYPVTCSSRDAPSTGVPTVPLGQCNFALQLQASEHTIPPVAEACRSHLEGTHCFWRDGPACEKCKFLQIESHCCFFSNSEFTLIKSRRPTPASSFTRRTTKPSFPFLKRCHLRLTSTHWASYCLKMEDGDRSYRRRPARIGRTFAGSRRYPGFDGSRGLVPGQRHRRQ